MEWLSMLYVYVVPFLRLLMRWRRRGVCECVMVQHDQQARHVVSSDACWLLRQSHTPSQASRKKRSSLCRVVTVTSGSAVIIWKEDNVREE
jgi:hypothetical protein